MKYPTGSFITKDGERRKVLGEAGEVRFISMRDKFDSMEVGYTISVSDLEKHGWVESPWVLTFLLTAMLYAAVVFPLFYWLYKNS